MSGSITILRGDCTVTLPTLAAGSADCCVTSPPYWGLRDYGIAPTDWPEVSYAPMPGLPAVTVPAQSACLGLETTPEAYVAHMVHVFRLVRRVLRDGATLWLNLGDCYATGAGKVGECPGGGEQGERWKTRCIPQVPDRKNPNAGVPTTQPNRMPQAGLKPKDLTGIPWRVAFALQADGWWLRSDVVWSKPNPMPESVTDRPTKAHEYVFLLATGARYFYDADAVREAHTTNLPVVSKAGGGRGAIGHADTGPDGWGSIGYHPAGRNKRSVWTIATVPFPGAHFAVWPPELARTCILAGTSERGCCVACGAPWERVVERDTDGRNAAGIPIGDVSHDGIGRHRACMRAGDSRSTTVGWRPTCDCGAETRPAVVLDPFGGSGTTGLVARSLGRRAVLCEASDEYATMAEGRADGTWKPPAKAAERNPNQLALFEEAP